MGSVKIYDIIPKRALVTRESARLVRDSLAAAVADRASEVILDFSGVEAVTPSFVDELITVLGEVAGPKKTNFRIVFLNPPTRLSEKFLAIGRGHGLRISESDPGTWTITEAPAA
jgi:hypothetical protein